MIRLEEKPFELNGKIYILRCNMAVLERVEDMHGDLDAVMQLPVRTASLELLAAMMNDYAELQEDWEEIWTPEKLKKQVSYAMLMELDLVGMLFRSISPQGSGAVKRTEDEKEPDDSGN